MDEIQKLDDEISDSIDILDIGCLNDIYLDCIINDDLLNKKQKARLLRSVSKEIQLAINTPQIEIIAVEDGIVTADEKNIDV